MQQEYRTQIVVKAHACGPGGRLKLKDLLDYFQDVAAEHASQLGVGIEEMGEHRVLWVLSRLKIRLCRDALDGERLELVTYPSGLNLLFAERQFRLLDATGATVCVGTSYWLLLEGASFHPLRPSECLPPSVLALTAESFFKDLSKIRRLADAREIFRIPVRPSDLDINNHVNNAQYGRYIMDVAWALCGGHVRFTELQINFNHQILLDNVVCCRGCLGQDGSLYVEGVSEDGRTSYFQAQAQVERIQAVTATLGRP